MTDYHWSLANSSKVIDYETVGENGGMMMLSVIGTAVSAQIAWAGGQI